LLHEEILASHARVEFNEGLVDIDVGGNFSIFRQFAKFYQYSHVVDFTTYTVYKA
jgi:hypothetical protein